MSEKAVIVKDLKKSFRLPHENQNSIKGKLINFHKRGYEVQEVLKGISFEVEKGDFFGIVGRNGSGKSTLLKLLSGIYHPDSGSIKVNGKLTPFIELGVGFNPELSGRDNVFLNGALLGFSRKEMEEKYDDIVAFSELERFMGQKLKNYSSGMQVRLAFSIAIQADTDVLILDEVLAVGDEAFQKKCFDYFNDLKKRKKTVILVTHDMASVQRFCNKALFLHNGEVKLVGSPEKVSGMYTISNIDNSKDDNQDNQQQKTSKYIDINKIYTKNNGKETNIFSNNEDIEVFVDFTVKREVDATIGLSLRRLDDTLLAGMGSKIDLGLSNLKKGKHTASCVVKAGQLLKDRYSLNISFWSESRELLAYHDSTLGSEGIYTIEVIGNFEARSGMFNINGEWRDI